MNETYLSLGSNEGSRELMLKEAHQMLTAQCGAIIKQSAIYETAAWGVSTQPSFLNMVVCLHTTLLPETLLQTILSIEQQLGRQRTIKWGQRTIDIDILLYNDLSINAPSLTIPHPLLQDRRFILVPLAEIAPGLVHPVFHNTVAQLLRECTDELEVKKLNLYLLD